MSPFKKSEKYKGLSDRLDQLEENLRRVDEKKTKEIKELKRKNEELEKQLIDRIHDTPQNIEELNQHLIKMNSDIREELENRLSEIETKCLHVNQKTSESLEGQMIALEQKYSTDALTQSVNSLISSQDRVDAIEADVKRSRNDTLNYRQNFSKRLCALESECQESQRQVLTTFTQIADVQRQIDEVTKTIEDVVSCYTDKGSHEKGNLSEQEKRLKSMRCIVVNLEQRKNICDHLSLAQRVVGVESQVKCLKEDQQRVTNLEAEMTEVRNQAESHHIAVGRDMDLLEKQIKRMGETWESDHQILPFAAHNSAGTGDTLAGDIQIKSDNEADGKKTESFWSHLITSTPLSRKIWAKIDRCQSFQSPGSNFKKGRCVFEPSTNGLYGLSVYMMQEGHGVLRTRLRFDDRTGSSGSTGVDGDVTAGLTVWQLKKGQKISVEVMQEEGTAQVYFCAFSGFLICPL